MALARDIYGWEVGAAYGASVSGTAGGATWVLDGSTARSGCYYGRASINPRGLFSLSRAIIGPFSNTTITTKAILRCAFQIATPVDTNDVGVMSIGGEPQIGGSSWALLQINSSNQWRVTLRAGHASAYSASPLVTGAWYLVEMELTCSQVWTGAFLNNSESVTCTLNSETLIPAPVISTGNFAQGMSGAILGFSSFAVWYSFGSAPTTGVYYFDDLTMLIGCDPDLSSVIFPVPNRVRLMGVSGQGAVAQWTGNASDLTSVPVNVLSPGQSSSVLGDVTLLAHPPAETAGVLSLGATGVEVVKVYGYLTIPIGSPIENLRIGPSAYPVNVSVAGSGSAAAWQWQIPGNPLTDAQLNALEFGWENATGAAIRTPAIHAEILCDLATWAEPGCGLYFPPGPVNPCTGARGAPNRGA